MLKGLLLKGLSTGRPLTWLLGASSSMSTPPRISASTSSSTSSLNRTRFSLDREESLDFPSGVARPGAPSACAAAGF